MGGVLYRALVAVGRFLGIDKLVGKILGWFSGPLTAIFTWFATRFTIKGWALGSQYFIVTLLFASKIAFVFAILDLISWTYNKFHVLMDSLNGFITMDDVFGTAWNVLQSIGFVDALFDTFQSLSHVWLSVLILIVLRISIKAFSMASDEWFKIGVLLGQ